MRAQYWPPAWHVILDIDNFVTVHWMMNKCFFFNRVPYTIMAALISCFHHGIISNRHQAISNYHGDIIVATESSEWISYYLKKFRELITKLPSYISMASKAQDCSNSIANPLELLQPCTKPLVSCDTYVALYPWNLKWSTKAHRLLFFLSLVPCLLTAITLYEGVILIDVVKNWAFGSLCSISRHESRFTNTFSDIVEIRWTYSPH